MLNTMAINIVMNDYNNEMLKTVAIRVLCSYHENDYNNEMLKTVAIRVLCSYHENN